MNVNLNSRADLNALNKLMADASIPNDVQVEGKKVEDHSLRITVGASGAAAVSVPSNRPAIDGVDGNPQVSLAELEEMVENISKSLGGSPSLDKGPANPPRFGKGPANPPRFGKGPANPSPSPTKTLDMAFNLFAVIDILQKAGIAFKNAAKEVNRLEHDHKRGLIEQEAKQIEKNGLSASASSRNSAILGLATSIGSAALTTVGTIYQMGAFKQSGVDALDKPIAENEGLLKDFQKIKGSGSLDDLAAKPPEIKPPEIKQQLDINKEGLGKPSIENEGIELQEIKPAGENKVNPEIKDNPEVKNPEVKKPEVEKKPEVGDDGLTETERKENVELVTEKGKVDAAKDDFDKCSKDVMECTIKKGEAANKLMEARKSNNPDEIKSAQDAFNKRQAELEAANTRLDGAADAHINASKEFRTKFDDLISKQKAKIADAKKAPNADAGKIKMMEDRLGKLKSVRDGTCSQIGDQIKDTLGYKISNLRSLRQDSMNNANNSKDFTTGKTWEAFAGIEKALGDSIGGFFRMESEAADGKGKSTARLIQRDEEQVDTARDATKAMQKGADELLDLLRDLRQTVTRLDHETAQAIFR